MREREREREREAGERERERTQVFCVCVCVMILLVLDFNQYAYIDKVALCLDKIQGGWEVTDECAQMLTVSVSVKN